MTSRTRHALPRRAHARGAQAAVRCSRCDAAARSRRAPLTILDTPDPDTGAWLTEHRLRRPLDKIDEPGDETPRGTAGRGQLSVEARRTASALDDSPGQIPGHVPGNTPVLAAVIDAAMSTLSMPTHSGAALSAPEPSTLAAIGGSATMSLQTFDPISSKTGAAPSAASMRLMETGLAFVAILVALLLNLGR